MGFFFVRGKWRLILIKKDNNIYLIQGIGVNIFPIIDSDELILFGYKLKNILIEIGITRESMSRLMSSQDIHIIKFHISAALDFQYYKIYMHIYQYVFLTVSIVIIKELGILFA